jgi:hypothetical protein
MVADTLVYYHTILLTFRPFLIFRGRWQEDMKGPSQHGGNRPTEVPTWLNEACNKALGAACKTIQFLSEASLVNELVRVRHPKITPESCYLSNHLSNQTLGTPLSWLLLRKRLLRHHLRLNARKKPRLNSPSLDLRRSSVFINHATR